MAAIKLFCYEKTTKSRKQISEISVFLSLVCLAAVILDFFRKFFLIEIMCRLFWVSIKQFLMFCGIIKRSVLWRRENHDWRHSSTLFFHESVFIFPLFLSSFKFSTKNQKNKKSQISRRQKTKDRPGSYDNQPPETVSSP